MKKEKRQETIIKLERVIALQVLMRKRKRERETGQEEGEGGGGGGDGVV